MDQQKIGCFLRELRKEKAITQEQLAEKAGVTNRSVSRWENGVNMPDFDILIQLADYYEVSVEEILDGERKKTTVKKEREMMQKIAVFHNKEKADLSRRVHYLFVLAIMAFIIYMALDIMELSDTGIYEDISSFSLGLVFGMLSVGALYTSKYYWHIRGWKRKVLQGKE